MSILECGYARKIKDLIASGVTVRGTGEGRLARLLFTDVPWYLRALKLIPSLAVSFAYMKSHTLICLYECQSVVSGI